MNSETLDRAMDALESAIKTLPVVNSNFVTNRNWRRNANSQPSAIFLAANDWRQLPLIKINKPILGGHSDRKHGY